MSVLAFLNYLGQEKRYSVNTIAAYENDLGQFQEFLNRQAFTWQQVKAAEIRAYIVELMDSGLSARAVQRKLSCLRSFYKFLMTSEGLKSNPVALVKGPKSAKPLPVFIPDAQMDQLLDAPDVFEPGFSGTRDKLVIELFFGTGIRLSELIHLKDVDYDVYQAQIKVLGKRNKERIIPLHKELQTSLGNYITLKTNMHFTNKSESLIVTDRGTDATPQFIAKIVKKYLSLVSTQKKKSPHVLRHSFASSLLNRGADINAIKELLGHASLGTTQIYTHNSVERLKKIYKQAHPKA
ncbi:MAG: integrase [Pedobacter sp.]|nr:MAG: integrase [Pedobacter sp.]